MPELTIQHQIKYTTTDPISILELVEALLSLEKVIHRSPAVLEELFPNTHIYDVKVFVKSLESGSLIEDILVKFVFGNQQEFEAFITSVREKCHMDVLKDNKALFSTIIIALVLAGGLYAIKKSGGDPEKVMQIEANNNTIINLGAGMVELSPEAFRAIIETAIKKDTTLAKDAIHVIRPAKKNGAAEIIFDGNDSTKITNSTVASVPTYLYQEDEAAEHFEDLTAAVLEVRAMDLDRKRLGWAAVVPSASKDRARLQIDAVIDLETLKGKTQLKGDVTLVWFINEDGSRNLKRIILRELKEAKD